MDSFLTPRQPPWSYAGETVQEHLRQRVVGEEREGDREDDVAQLVQRRTGEAFFSQSQLAVQTLLRCPYTPICNRMHQYLCARCNSCQSLVDYENTKTFRMHGRLGGATLSQLVFPRESNPSFP